MILALANNICIVSFFRFSWVLFMILVKFCYASLALFSLPGSLFCLSGLYDACQVCMMLGSFGIWSDGGLMVKSREKSMRGHRMMGCVVATTVLDTAQTDAKITAIFIPGITTPNIGSPFYRSAVETVADF
jgi:hypothetical protein